ncbi:FYVE zinc finger-domain-containing protein [Cyathus striatus]|nr:FYVE zinc finger-domain-containing protein [Cyathus striatus]
MSALAIALASCPCPSASVSAPAPQNPPAPLPASTPSSSSSSSLLDVAVPSLHVTTNLDRPNEHLAILLPNHLWKPDSLATQCDNFYCRVRFSLFERRHHCRKCGGVFCSACTSRSTPLLDTSNLDFLMPPRNVPLSSFESPTSPVAPCRVCDDCYDQIHGCPTTPRTPDLVRPSLKRALSHPISGESSLSSSLIATPPNPSISRAPRSLRPSPSISSIHTHTSSNSTGSHTTRVSIRTAHLPLPLDLERSYGELDAYPLKRSSVLCKATGGGRWEPKQSPILVGYRPPVPGAKAPYEIEMEREEQEERARKSNPVVRDGEFQYRFPREPEPMIMARSLSNLSTF